MNEMKDKFQSVQIKNLTSSFPKYSVLIFIIVMICELLYIIKLNSLNKELYDTVQYYKHTYAHIEKFISNKHQIDSNRKNTMELIKDNNILKEDILSGLNITND